MHIIFTDDDIDDRDFFALAMREVDPLVHLSMYSTGRDLLKVLRSSDGESLPDVILLDLNMPVMGGLECLTEIRKDKALDTVPVIIYSTSHNEDVISDARSQGANYYVVKPNSYNEIVKVAGAIRSMPQAEYRKTEKSNFILYKPNSR